MGYLKQKTIKIYQHILGGRPGNVMRGMLVLLAGNSIGRLMGLAAMPVLTRIYTPDDFGLLAVFSATVVIIMPLVTLRYVLAVPLPRSDGTAMNMLVLSALLMIMLSVVTAIVFWALGGFIFSSLSMAGLEPWWWLLALTIFLTAFYDLLSFWATRHRHYKIIAISSIWQSFAGVIVKISLGLIAVKGGLLIGQLTSQLSGSVALLRHYKEAVKMIGRTVTCRRLLCTAWRYRDFPFYRVPSQLLMALAQQAPLFFIAALFGQAETGQLGLAFLVLAVPVNLLGNTTAKAFYAEAAHLGTRQPQHIQSLLLDITRKLAALSIPPALLLFFTGQWLFSIIFGRQWLLTGEFASALSLTLLLQFLQMPVAHIFYIFEGQRALLLLNLQRILLVITVFLIAYQLNFNAVQSIWFYALTLGLHYGLSIIYTFRFLSKQVKY